MSYSYDKFLRPITSSDKSIKILDDTNDIKYTIDPFVITNVAAINNILRISLKSLKVILLSFSTKNETKVALTRLKEQIDLLTTNVPILIDKDIKNYIRNQIEQVGIIVGPTGPTGSADRYYATSSTTFETPVVGEVVDLITQMNLAYSPAQNVVVYSDLPNLYDSDYQFDGAYFVAQIDYYDSQTGDMSLVTTLSYGTGTYSYWYINLSGMIPDGATGSTGSDGLQGPTGPEGPRGLQGIEGPQGPQGPQGIEGPQGTSGFGIEFEGQLGSTASLPQPSTQGFAYLIDDVLWVYDSLGNWVDGGSIQGPQGPQGLQGPQGTQGIQGIEGPIGPTGSDGLQGPIGPTGSDGLQGPIGPTGSDGLQGPIGPTGSDGLQGPIGPTGSDGLQGPTGPSADTSIFVPYIGATNDVQLGNFGLETSWDYGYARFGTPNGSTTQKQISFRQDGDGIDTSTTLSTIFNVNITDGLKFLQSDSSNPTTTLLQSDNGRFVVKTQNSDLSTSILAQDNHMVFDVNDNGTNNNVEITPDITTFKKRVLVNDDISATTYNGYVPYNSTNPAGYISSAITSLNGLTSSTQLFVIGTTGSNFNIVSTGATHTFNLPDASLTARGVVTTGIQTFEGTKTFNADVIINSLRVGRGASNNVTNTVLGNEAFPGANINTVSTVAIGYRALFQLGVSAAFSNNTSIGANSLASCSQGVSNTAIGSAALFRLGFTSNNVAVGVNAGSSTNAAGLNQAPANSVYIGNNTTSLTNNNSNQIVIGDSAQGLGTNTVVLGNDSIVTTALKGDVVIGTTTPITKLTVVGTTQTGSTAVGILDLSQTWNTTGNPTAFLLNVTNTTSGANAYLMDLQVSGITQFRVTKAGAVLALGQVTTPAITQGAGGNATSISLGGALGTIAYSAQTPTTLTANHTFTGSGVFLASGHCRTVAINTGFSVSSGTASFTSLFLNETINQTGSATGITRGLWINPTLTSAVDYRAIETTNGKVILTDTISAGSGALTGSLLDLSQTWNTTGSPTTIKLNVTDTNSSGATPGLLLDLQVGGISQFAVNKSGRVGVLSTTSYLGRSYTSNGGGSSVQNAFVTTLAAVHTSGISYGFLSSSSPAPTSGTGVYNAFTFLGIINQTGGANGITRGLYINPTIVSAFDFRAIETTNGKVILTDTISAGSGSLAGSLLDLQQTWNTTGAPTAIKLNVTDTASNTASLLIDLQVSGSSIFSINKSGGLSATTFNSNIIPNVNNTLTIGSSTNQYGNIFSNVFSSNGTGILRSGTNLVFQVLGGTVEAARFDNNGNFGIGTTPVTRLSIVGVTQTGISNVGIMDLSQTWNTTGTVVAFNLNVTNTTSNGASSLFRLQTNGINALSVNTVGALYFGSSGGAAAIGGAVPSTGLFANAGAGTGVLLAHFLTTQVGYGIWGGRVTGARTVTSGENGMFKTTETYQPTSGTGVYNTFNLSPTINQTGGANGITRGLYINPTITAATDFRAIETTNGKIILTDTTSAGSDGLTASLLSLNQTWNTTGIPTALLMNVTDTASNSNSLLMDLQVGGISKFNVSKNGNITGSAFNGYTPLRSWKSGIDGATVANTLTITPVYTQLIPAGTFVADDVVEVLFRATAPLGKTSVTNIYIYVNTTNNLTGTPIQIGTYNTTGTGRTTQIERRLAVKGTTTRVINPATATATDTVQSAAMSALTIDWTIDQYFIFAIGHTVNDQIMFGDFYRIIKN